MMVKLKKRLKREVLVDGEAVVVEMIPGRNGGAAEVRVRAKRCRRPHQRIVVCGRRLPQIEMEAPS